MTWTYKCKIDTTPWLWHCALCHLSWQIAYCGWFNSMPRGGLINVLLGKNTQSASSWWYQFLQLETLLEYIRVAILDRCYFGTSCKVCRWTEYEAMSYLLWKANAVLEHPSLDGYNNEKWHVQHNIMQRWFKSSWTQVIYNWSWLSMWASQLMIRHRHPHSETFFPSLDAGNIVNQRKPGDL